MSYDLITVGRVNMDLFSQSIGAAFADITGFDAMVGGSPANIAIGTARLGLRPVLFSAVGEDRVGDFVLRYLGDEGVDTSFMPRKAGKLTSLALLGVQPPDHFPLSFYRDDPADIHLTVDDARALPFPGSRAIQLSGNAYSRGTCADAARFCAEEARRHGLTSFIDLDLRPTDWPTPRSYGVTLRAVLPLVDVVIGTEEELFAALAAEPEYVMAGSDVSPDDHEALEVQTADLVAAGTVEAVVLKRGPRGATVFTAEGLMEVPGFPVEVVNTVGAGDAFASGLIRTRLDGWEWYRAAGYANACGAIEVTRHGCSVALPRRAEVEQFIDAHGGL